MEVESESTRDASLLAASGSTLGALICDHSTLLSFHALLLWSQNGKK